MHDSLRQVGDGNVPLSTFRQRVRAVQSLRRDSRQDYVRAVQCGKGPRIPPIVHTFDTRSSTLLSLYLSVPAKIRWNYREGREWRQEKR